MPRANPDKRRRQEGRRERFVNTGQASEMLGGLLSAAQIRRLALTGQVRGAIKVGDRVLIPVHVVPSLVTELEFSAQIAPPKKVKIVRPLAS